MSGSFATHPLLQDELGKMNTLPFLSYFLETAGMKIDIGLASLQCLLEECFSHIIFLLKTVSVT